MVYYKNILFVLYIIYAPIVKPVEKSEPYIFFENIDRFN